MRKSQWFWLLISIAFSLSSRVFLEHLKNTQFTNESPSIQTQNPAPLPAPTIKNPPTEEIERQIHEKINAYRISLGLSPLILDYRITNEARIYSAKMASGAAQFSHDGFEGRAKDLEKQALEYKIVGENLALLQGYNDLATVAVEGWIASPGHRKNIVGDYELTGIGVAASRDGVYYFTQLFLKRQ